MELWHCSVDLFFLYRCYLIELLIFIAAYLNHVTRSTLYIKFKWSIAERFSSEGKYFISKGYAKIKSSEFFFISDYCLQSMKWWYAKVSVDTTSQIINLVFNGMIDYGLWNLFDKFGWINYVSVEASESYLCDYMFLFDVVFHLVLYYRLCMFSTVLITSVIFFFN